MVAVVLRKALVHELEVKTAKRDALTTVMSFVNFVHLRSFPQFYPHRWISRHIGLSLICMSLIFLRFSFPLPLPQLYNTAFYCVSKTLTANCEPTFMTARLPVCLPACLEQDITIYRILCNRDITYYVCTLKLTMDAQWSLLGLGGQIGQINLAKLSAPILVQWVPCPFFHSTIISRMITSRKN